MMRKVLSCFGFVPDFSIGFIQTSAITRLFSKHSLSCNDHQLIFSSLVIAHLTVLKLLGFFYFSELIFKLRQLRLNANTHVERRFECFGNVSGEFRLSTFKQNSLILFFHQLLPRGGAANHVETPKK